MLVNDGWEKQETKESTKAETKQPVKETSIAAAPSDTPGAIGSKAVNFSLIDLDGEKVSLSDFEGKVIMLNFWATWCSPCRQEIPDFIKMYEKHESEGLVILGVSGFREDSEKIKSFVADQGMNYPILFMSQDEIQPTINKYGGIEGIPTTFLIDREGIIREKWVGPRSETVFMAEINKYLK